MINFWQRAVLILDLALISANAFAAQQAYKLRVDGLACQFCAYGVEKKLNATKGVEGIGVNIASETVTIMTSKGASL